MKVSQSVSMMEITLYRTIGQLTRYWRTLRDLSSGNIPYMYLHLIVKKVRVTVARVRRNLMVAGYSGTSVYGYDVKKMREHIETFLFKASGEQRKAVIVGIDNFGRALLKFFSGWRLSLKSDEVGRSGLIRII
ncbi:MAG: hypothetical protein LBB40_01125 [Holophagales bacterium]|jgi:NADH/NAD ratio-sensing transcriptional regulator Rex|nr:hypothetical protein [Holophagales bacterium]